MGQLRIVQHGSIELDGQVYQIGDPVRSHSFTFTEMYRDTVTLAASGTAVLLDITATQSGGGVNLGSFSVLLIASDRDVTIEEIVDEGNQVGQRVQSWTCKGSGTANKYGLYHFRGSDNAYASDHTENFGGAATLDNIETIRVKNTDATNAAQVTIIACA